MGCSTTGLRQQDRENRPKRRMGQPGAAEIATRSPATQERWFSQYLLWSTGFRTSGRGRPTKDRDSIPGVGAMAVPRAFCRGVTLRTGLLTAVAAVLLHFGLSGGQPGHAFVPSYGVYSIPSTSMAPTLQINDYVMSFGLAKVARGDVVVYLLPKDGSTVYIKRVVGLPGDRVQMKGGVLHLNGTPAKQERLEDAALKDYDSKPRPMRQYLETLPGGVSHRIYDELENGFLDNTAEYTV